jgi:hypothetical protein
MKIAFLLGNSQCRLYRIDTEGVKKTKRAGGALGPGVRGRESGKPEGVNGENTLQYDGGIDYCLTGYRLPRRHLKMSGKFLGQDAGFSCTVWGLILNCSAIREPSETLSKYSCGENLWVHVVD